MRIQSRHIHLLVALLIFAGISLLPAPEGLKPEGMRAIAIFSVCAYLWITSAIPVMITSLLAIVLFPLSGVLPTKQVYSLFGNEVVFFILGAFILASALQRSGLSRRIALLVLDRFGQGPGRLLLGILLLPAFLSLWMSEHAVAAMLFPIVTEITDCLGLDSEKSNYGKGLYIALAWGCIIGGIVTFLGGARAPLAVGILRETSNQTIDFIPWALASLPTALILIVAAYFIIRRIFPGEIVDVAAAHRLLSDRVAALPRASAREWSTGLLMLGTILTWIVFGKQLGLANIAISAVVLAFVLGLMKWKEVEEDVNWGVLLMYGGAICLGFAIEQTGSAKWLAAHTLGQFVHSGTVLIAALSLISIVLTEVISNSAVVAILMPLAIGLAPGVGLDARTVTMALAIPSGLAFTLPMGTPAMAIAFSSGYLRIRDTVRAGMIINVVAWCTFNLVAYYWWPLLGFVGGNR